jgi:hypothetical protein
MSSRRITASKRRSIRQMPRAGQSRFCRPGHLRARISQDLVRQRNLTRHKRFTSEQQALCPLPRIPLSPCRELRTTVSRFSTIQVVGNTYSVPSRLIGTQLLVRVRAETVEGYVGTHLVFTLSRLQGKQQHAINYRHVIWSLVRKPGAFAAYRYRDELFKSLAFRRAYDQLQQEYPKRADREYLRLLHLAATLSESEVETALVRLSEAGQVPTFDTVRDLVSLPHLPVVSTPQVHLEPYDQLLLSRRCAHG